MANDVLLASSELSSPGYRPKKGRHLWKIILSVAAVIVFSILISASVQITYDYVRYEKFFVNGESMYPTLNSDAVYYYSDGTKSTTPVFLMGDFSSIGSYYCDYGLMDNQIHFREKIKRFDIVVTYYDSDMVYDVSTSLYKVHEDADGKIDKELKIKRVIGLPGESVYFDDQGELYVKKVNASDYVLVPQPFLDLGCSANSDEKEWSLFAKQETASGITYGSVHNPCSLSEGQYFLCGDNRIIGASEDSRTIGPIDSYALMGKAIAIIAKCTYIIPKEGVSAASLKINWASFQAPWNLEYLDTYDNN